jgi:hypothetical protein
LHEFLYFAISRSRGKIQLRITRCDRGTLNVCARRARIKLSPRFIASFADSAVKMVHHRYPCSSNLTNISDYPTPYFAVNGSYPLIGIEINDAATTAKIQSDGSCIRFLGTVKDWAE